jgi:hypothetical protein
MEKSLPDAGLIPRRLATFGPMAEDKMRGRDQNENVAPDFLAIERLT